MKILSPIDSPDEVDALIDAGADELYGGYVPGRWLQRYSLMGSINQRYFASAQIPGDAGLRRIIKAAHRRGVKFHITLNAPFYLKAQYGDVMKEASRLRGLGVDAFIVSDLGLILRLRESMPDAELHLSTLGTVFNSESARFFSRLGIRRMVLPRELTIKELSNIIKANPGTEFDAFILIGKCPNIEGYCGFTHNNPQLVWPCEEAYRMEVLKGDTRVDGIINAQMGWSRVNRRQACGLCAVSRLQGAGVSTLKLVGRGGPTLMKVKVARAVRRMLDLAGGGGGVGPLNDMARDLYKGIFGRECNPYICYFPEVWR